MSGDNPSRPVSLRTSESGTTLGSSHNATTPSTQTQQTSSLPQPSKSWEVPEKSFSAPTPSSTSTEPHHHPLHHLQRSSFAELMRWRDPGKYGDPDFANTIRPGEEQEFFFPRHAVYGSEWKLATNESASHWLSSKEYYNSKFLRAQKIKGRAIDRGNLQSRFRRKRLDDLEHRFSISKLGVPVKRGKDGGRVEPHYGRVDLWKDPDTGVPKTHFKELVDPSQDDSGDVPGEDKMKRVSISSVLSEDDPYYFGDPYLNDPSLFYREIEEEENNKESSSSESIEPEPVAEPSPEQPSLESSPVGSSSSSSSSSDSPPSLPSIPPEGIDYIFKNARFVCSLPPRRPSPNIIDDSVGTRRRYCETGLANVYVHKADYGVIPSYLKKRNRELGRPSEPDFEVFYQKHSLKIFGGSDYCANCGRQRNIVNDCGDDLRNKWRI